MSWLARPGMKATIEEFGQMLLQVGPTLLRKYDEVKNLARLMPWRGKIRHNRSWVREDRIWFTDPHIFDLLTLPLLRGDPETALQTSHSLVLTPAMANKYFGDEDPMGKTLKMQMATFPAFYTFTVTGILKHLPKTSSMRIDFLAHIPYEQLTADQRKISRTMSLWVHAMIFVELSHSSTHGLVQEKLKDLYCHDPDKSMGLEQMAFEIHPFKHAYLRSKARYVGSITDLRVGEEVIRSGSLQSLVFIAILGGIALVFSMLNFTMLSIARSVRQRRKRVWFIGESVLLAGLAILPALGLTDLLLPFFNDLVHRELEIRHAFNWIHLMGMVGIAAITSLVPGICLALGLRLSGSGVHGSPLSFLFSKALLLVQISICALVLVFALALLDETNAPKSRDLGFTAKNLIFFSGG